MMVDLDKTCDKNEFNNIKTSVGYSLKSTLCKISYVNIGKLAQIIKKLINLGIFYIMHRNVISLMAS